MKRAILTLAAVFAIALASVPGHAATTMIVVAGFQYVPSGYVTPNPLNLPAVPGALQVAPAIPVVHAGDTLAFTNADALPHTVTKLSGPLLGTWSAKSLAPAGGTASLFLTPGFPTGTYVYYCTVHPGMRGAFTVQ